MTDKDPHPQKTPDKAKGPGTWIALAFITARDALARCLLSLKLGPDTLTAAGLLFTIAAAVFLALGAGDAHHTFAGFGQAGWRLWAVIFFILSAAADMLDGAMARIGGKMTKFGAFLDSTIDRYSDALLFGGIGFYYALHHNLTYQVLAVVAMANALIISYTKARAEDFIPSCKVGFWERGERLAALLIAAACGAFPAVLWELAIFPFFTALRRIQFTFRAIRTLDQEQEIATDSRGQVTDGCFFDRFRHGSFSYDLLTAAYITFIILAPIDNTDVFRRWLS